jgi:putative DNA primase/helicase
VSDRNHTPASDALAVTRLASMTYGDYDRVRLTEAQRLGWRVDTLDAAVEKARVAGRMEGPDRPPEFSDDALALRFTEQNGDRLRYVAIWNKWLIREPTVWRVDKTLEVFNLARRACRAAAAECGDSDLASAITSAKTVGAVERLAKADRRHAADHEMWDADPWLLNTPAGVVDLRTGELRDHSATDYMTKITAAAPEGDCPLWWRFLDRITNGDSELQRFLQRIAGYCLTGSTKAHAMFFGFGTGANGKGTLINTLSAIMGEYATTATMESFTVSRGERHPTDLAMLRGARFVTAQETEEGRGWAESRIKALTGGDPISARFMRQDFFTFVPTFKLFIMGNHKPALRNVDEAIRRRMHLIPFVVKIDAAERDQDLPEKLKPEWPGILNWAIDGCLEWLSRGLAPPDAVLTATEDYLEAEDTLATWIGEQCRTGVYGFTETKLLFANWRQWANEAGEEVGSRRRFSQALEGRGYRRRKSGGQRVFEGIVLKVPPSRFEPEHERD